MNTPENTPEPPAAPSVWYIVQQPGGTCDILSAEALQSSLATAKIAPQTWGSFSAKGEAIARRVGLIRAGKCQPH